jgi:hypothetical protein
MSTLRNGVDGSYVSRLVNLTILAPDIVAAILDETLPPEVTLFELAAGTPRAPCRTPSIRCSSTEPDQARSMLPILNSASLGVRHRQHLNFWRDPSRIQPADWRGRSGGSEEAPLDSEADRAHFLSGIVSTVSWSSTKKTARILAGFVALAFALTT